MAFPNHVIIVSNIPPKEDDTFLKVFVFIGFVMIYVAMVYQLTHKK